MNRVIKNIVPALLLVAMLVVGCRKFDAPFLELDKDVPEMTEPGLWVASETIYFDAGFNKVGFEFRALGGEWTLTPKEQYSHLVGYTPNSGGDGNFMIEVEVLPNNGLEETDLIFVATQKNTNTTFEITVKQYTHESKFNRATDSLALLKIAESLNSKSWEPRNVWDPKKPITTWAGLTFEEIRGEMRVVEFVLNDWNLRGEVPVEIGNLRELKVWNIEGSRLQGRLPNSIANLRNLQTINIDFSSNVTFFIPENMDNMLALRMFRMGSMKVTYFENLYKLPVIEELICGEGLSGDLKDGIAKLSKLKVLNLYLSNVTKLPADLGSMESLENLNVRDCYVLKELPASIGNLQTLKTLNISRSGLVTLPENIGSLTNLEPFGLSYCIDLESLPESLCNLPYNGSLNLSGCESLKSLPNGLGNMSGLTALNLTNCKALTDLSANMGTTITELNLSNCKAMTSLSASVCDMSQLVKLNLSSSGIESLPENFSNLTSLEELNLSYSKLKSLPSTFGDLPKLKILNLSNLPIESLPSNFGDLSTLEELTISSSNLTSLPDSFGDLIGLKELTMNSLSPSVVVEGSVLAKLVNMEFISVSKCTFDGAGLDWISKMTKAYYIEVTDSKMGGTIDWSIFPASLKTLDLTNCEITGTLDGIGLLSDKLTNITLNNNLLSGDIPKSIGQCVKLSRFSLLNNNITGTIPEELLKTAMTGYSSLTLNGNRMSGAIPESVLSSTQWSRWKSNVITQQSGYGFSNVR